MLDVESGWFWPIFLVLGVEVEGVKGAFEEVDVLLFPGVFLCLRLLLLHGGWTVWWMVVNRRDLVCRLQILSYRVFCGILY